MSRLSFTPLEMLAEILKHGSVYSEDTKEFENYAHDKDLLPMFVERITALMDIYKKRYIDIQDIQGIKDEGCDIFLRYYDDKNEKYLKAGLQIKSHKEIDDWLYEGAAPSSSARGGRKRRVKRTKASLVGLLKQQMYEAVFNARADDVYVVLCGDAIKHKRGLRLVPGALQNADKVRVIQPEQALYFLKMSEFQVSVFVDRRLYEGDPIFNKAMNEISEEEPFEVLLKCALIFGALEKGYTIDEDGLRDAVDTAERWASQLQRDGYLVRTDEEVPGTSESALDGVRRSGLIRTNYSDGMYDVSPQDLPAFCSIYFQHKYIYDRFHAQEGLVQLVAMDLFDPEDEENVEEDDEC